jgi:hypothetical protein
MRHRPKWIIGAATVIAAAAIATGAAVPALAQQSGGQRHPTRTTHASCGITLVPTGTSPDLSTVIPAKPHPLRAVPVICGPSGTTGAPVRITPVPITLVPASPVTADPVG